MTMTKYFFKCKDCGRTITEIVGAGKPPGLFFLNCPNTVKCGGGGRYKPSEAFKIKTVPVSPTRRKI
jgi:hypothetical protein